MDESEARRNTPQASSPLDEITIAEDSAKISEDSEFDSGIYSSAGSTLDIDLNTGREDPAESPLLDGLNWRDEVADRVEKFRKRRGTSRSHPEKSSNLDFDFGATAEPETEVPSQYRPKDISSADGSPRRATRIEVRGAPPLVDERRAESIAELLVEEAFVSPVTEEPVIRQAEARDAESDYTHATSPRRAGARRHPSGRGSYSPTHDFDTGLRPEKVTDSRRWLEDPASTVGRVEIEPFEPSAPSRTATPLSWENQSGDEVDGQADSEGISVAPIRRRFLAGLIDAGILIMCGGLFALIFRQAGGRIPHGILAGSIFAFIALVFTTTYFGLFTAMSGTTVGLEALGMRISRPDGRMPSPSEALMRALGYVFSSAALMLGFLWALVDGDGLTWHDRMSDTMVTTAPLPTPEAENNGGKFVGTEAQELSW